MKKMKKLKFPPKKKVVRRSRRDKRFYSVPANLDEIITDNRTVLGEIEEEEKMAHTRSKLTKNRKLEKSFEDLLTGLSDESDDDIDDLVDFDNLPEMCSEDTLLSIAKTNKAYANNESMDDSLNFLDKSEKQETKKDEVSASELFADDKSLLSGDKKENDNVIQKDQLIDFDDLTETNDGNVKNNEPNEFESCDVKASVNLLDFDDQDNEENEIQDNSNENDDNEDEDDNEMEEEDEDKYEGSFEMEDEKNKSGGIELMVTDESGNALNMNDTAEMLNGIRADESIDLDAIVQDNSHLDVGVGKQKISLRKKGSLAKRRKPSRTSVHSMGDTNEDSHFKDSTEPKPVQQNGETESEDVFSRHSSSSSEATSPSTKKPLPGMVALPGLGLPMAGPRKKTSGSTPSDSDLTPEDQPRKDVRSYGVKLPIPHRGSRSSESENQSDISAPVLRKTSDREPVKAQEENIHQFEKPKLKAVSRPEKDRKEPEDTSASLFDMPTLNKVERTPRKSKSSDSSDADSKHVFQTPKLRRVEDAPTESLQFIQGKTGESEDFDDISSGSRISDDSRHVFQSPKLKKVDNPPTQTLKLLHGRTDETVDTEMKLDLNHHTEESSTDDMNYGIYFEKPQLRNVPKITDTLKDVYREKSKFDVPELRNVPKAELELKSPPASDSDKKFNVPQLQSVQKEKELVKEDKEEGVFQIPKLRSTPLPKRREPPKSPETKTFDVPVLRRTPSRVKHDSESTEDEKVPTGIFEKPKLKSARSLQQDIDNTSNNDSSVKHRFDMPTLRNTPSKTGSSVQKSGSSKSDNEKPSWLQETKLKPARSSSIEKSSVNEEEEKPSWLSSSKDRYDAKENHNTNNSDSYESTPRKSSNPLQETRGNQDNAINGHHTPRRGRLTSTGSDKDGDDVKSKKGSGTGRDQYVPSWLKTVDTRGKSPSTPNLAFVTPSKETSEIPRWKRELAEKRKGRRDSDAGTPRKSEGTTEKGLPPWKVELGQKKMRQTPAKAPAQETKKTSEPEWKKAADEKRQRLRSLGDSNYEDGSGLLESIKATK